MTPARKIRLLVVEDDQRSQAGLRAWLGEEDDLDIRQADSVGMARDLLGSDARFDVVILDLDLPMEPGEALLATIAGTTPRPKTVVVSGTAIPGRIDRILADGPAPIVAVPKPYHFDDLLAAIRGESPVSQPKG